MIGTKVAHYAITGKLGEGGMGVVYEAIDGHLDRAIALKILPHDALSNPSRRQRFVQEAKSASGLNHPHIVTIYDIGSADGVDYIAMELIRGVSIEQALSRGKLRLSDALKYGAQIADALAATHAAGIVHRDLKPLNIMITERGDIKVLDFGLAKLTDPAEVTHDEPTYIQRAVTEEGSVVGSAPYMSPEQAEGGKVDARSDIFSFGSVLYEMLTGKRAFSGKTRMATMAAVLNSEPEPIAKLAPEIPREVERWVNRCLRKDLNRRSQSMAEIRVALQDLREESESGSLSASNVTAVSTGGSARHRPRWLYYSAAAVLCVAAAAAFWFFGPGRPAAPLSATVLTSFVGAQSQPSLSPDGNQFAFTWDGDVPNGPLHIYISLTGKGTPLRLTPENETATYPAWSPDGQSIAYVAAASGQQPELRVMPALGGPGRRIATSGRIVGYQQYLRVSWSPDSKWLLWSELGKTRIFSIQAAPATGGEPRRLLDPPNVGVLDGDTQPAVSPDGRRLVFRRQFDVFDAELYLADFDDGRLAGKPVQLTHDRGFKSSPIWTNDGKDILYIAGEFPSDFSIYRVPASGGEPRLIEGIGAHANSLTLSAKASRLLYSTASINYDIHRLDLTAADPKPERFLSSTRMEDSPTYSPDGKRIAFSSNRGGIHQIWVSDADGGNISPLTSFPTGYAGSPKWSPDGKYIVFDARPQGNSDIYTVPSGGGPVKQLTNNPADDHVPFWSRDNWIYFSSSRTSAAGIFRMRPDGSAVQQVTQDGGEYGEVSPDGQWLYYFVTGKGLWKMPSGGGKSAQVLAPEFMGSGLMWVLGTDGIYVTRSRQAEGFPVVFYPFDGGKPRTIATLSHAAVNFPAVSPDGHWFLYTTTDQDPTYGVMRVDNFR